MFGQYAPAMAGLIFVELKFICKPVQLAWSYYMCQPADAAVKLNY